MRLPMEREHMMLAGGEELDVAQQHHFVVLFRLELSDKHILRALRVTPIEFLPGTHNPGGGLPQSFAIRIFSAALAQNFANQFFGIDDRRLLGGGGCSGGGGIDGGRLYRSEAPRILTIKPRDDGS